SVVIAAYNAAGTLGEHLEALAQQCWSAPWEVLVMNNRSTDATARVARAFAARIPGLRVLDAADKQGAAYAMNQGVRASGLPAFAFCGAYGVVGEGWGASMVEALGRYAFVSGSREIERLNRDALARNRPAAQTTGIQEYVYPPFLPHCGAGDMG